MKPNDWVTIATILGARGNKGEVAAWTLSSYPERFGSLKRVWLAHSGGGRQEMRVETVWEHKGRLIFKFAGVDTISQAEELAGSDIQVSAAERWPAAEGEFFHSDLVGCEVIERGSGRWVGRVEGIEEYGGPALLEVSAGGAGEPLLIPFVRAICVEIDPAAGRIVVDLPEGMEDLGRVEGAE